MTYDPTDDPEDFEDETEDTDGGRGDIPSAFLADAVASTLRRDVLSREDIPETMTRHAATADDAEHWSCSALCPFAFETLGDAVYHLGWHAAEHVRDADAVASAMSRITRDLQVAVLDTDHGVSERTWEILREYLDADVYAAVRATDGRYYLPEGFGADVIDGGDGYSSHADCKPSDAVGDLSGADGSACWICGEDL